jgi:carboxyl-terminal processing protease
MKPFVVFGLALFCASAALVPATVMAEEADRPPACTPLPPGPPVFKPITTTTIGQAYYCILKHYVRGPIMDPRSLLVPAFAASTQELQRRGLDQPQATLPALTDEIDYDWAAFSRVYDQILSKLSNDPTAQQAVAASAIRAMVDSLHENHTGWARAFSRNLTGLELSGFLGAFVPANLDPTDSDPGVVIAAAGPAERAGIKVGDEILAINDVPLVTNGVVSLGVLKGLDDATPQTPVQISLRRLSTNETLAVTLTPGDAPPPPPSDPRLLNGNIGYQKIRGFAPGVTAAVLARIATLQKEAPLRGIILDLRGNMGGEPTERAKLLGAFAHDRITHYWCNAQDQCEPQRTDDSIPLLNLPLVVLTDRHCASACDSFVSAVKDLRLGTIVGTRTGGVVGGPPDSYALDDGSLIQFPYRYEISANRETVNTIGVAPDYYAPRTGADLSAGRDPGLAKALALFE